MWKEHMPFSCTMEKIIKFWGIMNKYLCQVSVLSQSKIAGKRRER